MDRFENIIHTQMYTLYRDELDHVFEDRGTKGLVMYLHDYHWTERGFPPGNPHLMGAINTTNGTAHQPPTRHTYFGDFVLI